MCKQLLRSLLVGLLLAGCGGSTPNSTPDAPIVVRQLPEAGPGLEASVTPPPGSGVDAGAVTVGGGSCDEDAKGEDFCIKNPGDNRGGGVPVTRQDPPSKCSP